jgi:hydroxyethylthiazole kinase-like sugar kinase family protein
MTAMRPLQARENAKCTRHKAASNAEGYSFYPWVVDPFGSTTQTARKLVKQAVTTAAVYGSASAPNEKQFLAHIAASVYLGTAAIYSAGLGSANIHATQQHL